MARSFARIDVHRFTDPEWRQLRSLAKTVHDMLWTHPKLTLCGSLDVKLGSWVQYDPDLDMTSLVGVLECLEEGAWIGWDRVTDELAIRAFVERDRVCQNVKSAKGMWSAWQSIESESLRLWLVDNFPESAFEERFDPPIPRPRNTDAIDRSYRSFIRSIDPTLTEPQPPLLTTDAAGASARCDLPPVDGQVGNVERFTPAHMRGRADA